MNFRRRNLYELIQREVPGDPGGGQSSDPLEPTTFEAAIDALSRSRSALAQSKSALERSNSELDKARKEAAGYRVGARGQGAVAARRISGLLGEPVADDAEPPSFDDLVPKLESAVKGDTIKKLQGEVRTERLGRVLAESFHALNLKPKLARGVLISEGHMERLQADVDKPDFDEIVSTTLEELAENMPEVRGSGSGPTRTSAPMRPPANDMQVTQEELAAMSPEEVQKALHSGKLNTLLGRS